MPSHGALDDRYFEWLYGQIGSVKNKNPARSHWKLARQLYTTPFHWHIPNDDNRAEDGRDLRFEFLDEQMMGGVDPSWQALECSMLEMLIALSRRVAFEAPGSPDEWFWEMLQNLGVRQYTDIHYSLRVEREVGAAIERVIDRTYRSDGKGGLFPLKHPDRDQRKVELWYQVSAYLLEDDRAHIR